jgi:hypothetical protein
MFTLILKTESGKTIINVKGVPAKAAAAVADAVGLDIVADKIRDGSHK